MIEVQYPSKFWGKGYDEQIEKAVGDRDSSGMGFGFRDMQFTRETMEEALACVTKLNKLGLKGLEVNYG